MTPVRFVSLLALASALLGLAGAHGGHEQEALTSPDGDWATWHMTEEHHISNFDPSSFFLLHDFDSDGVWEYSEVRRFLGFDDESTDNVTEEKKGEAIHKVFKLFDMDEDDLIDGYEFVEGIEAGHRIPDFGYGPGHHGDDETEYELHHFEKYHDENTREEDLTHPEDIAHFKKHREMEEAADRQELFDAMTVVEANIPAKFRKY